MQLNEQHLLRKLSEAESKISHLEARLATKSRAGSANATSSMKSFARRVVIMGDAYLDHANFDNVSRPDIDLLSPDSFSKENLPDALYASLWDAAEGNAAIRLTLSSGTTDIAKDVRTNLHFILESVLIPV